MASALILAAGRGERLGGDRPKALAELAGRPLLQWSIEVLRGVPAIERIVIALPAGVAGLEEIAGLGAGGGIGGEESRGAEAGGEDGGGEEAGVIAVPGGAVRSESVRLALAAAEGGQDSDLVLVHDAARPLLTGALVEAVIAAAQSEGVDGAIAAAPVTDTVKRAGADRVISETLERASLWAVQTPQVFRRVALEQALDVSEEVLAQATDDAWLVERAGGRVLVVEAPRENLKVTTPLDLALAEILLAQRGEKPSARSAGDQPAAPPA